MNVPIWNLRKNAYESLGRRLVVAIIIHLIFKYEMHQASCFTYLQTMHNYDELTTGSTSEPSVLVDYHLQMLGAGMVLNKNNIYTVLDSTSFYYNPSLYIFLASAT